MQLPSSSLAKPDPADAADPERDAHWEQNLRVTGLLLAVWFAVTFGISFFARELNFSFFGWPFSFWVAAQGALVVYLAIVGFYARAMNRLDHLHGVAEEE